MASPISWMRSMTLVSASCRPGLDEVVDPGQVQPGHQIVERALDLVARPAERPAGDRIRGGRGTCSGRTAPTAERSSRRSGSPRRRFPGPPPAAACGTARSLSSS